MYYNYIITMGLRKIQVDAGEVVFKNFEYDLVHFVFIILGFFRQFAPDRCLEVVGLPCVLVADLDGLRKSNDYTLKGNPIIEP